ncbi:hypothetical protein Hanom_Chr13g01213271 [Helianthus anomalus]
MEHDFYEDFQGWMYNQSTSEAMISLFDKKTGESRRINVLDPMWLVNCSKKDIECLFYNKIVYEKARQSPSSAVSEVSELMLCERYQFWQILEVKVQRLGFRRVLEKREAS